MTPRESLMVTRLVNRWVAQADLSKDADAEFELAMWLKTRADAPYLLLQRSLAQGRDHRRRVTRRGEQRHHRRRRPL